MVFETVPETIRYPSNRMSRKIFLALAVIVPCGLVLATLPFALGRSASGKASTPSAVPFVGEDLAELDFITPAAYNCFQHPHGGGTCRIRGSTSHAALVRFCDNAGISLNRGGTVILNRDAILDYLRNHGIDIRGVVSTEDALVMFGMGGRFHKLYGAYDPATQRFWIWLQFVGHRSYS